MPAASPTDGKKKEITRRPANAKPHTPTDGKTHSKKNRPEAALRAAAAEVGLQLPNKALTANEITKFNIQVQRLKAQQAALPPVKPLDKSDNRWQIGAGDSDEEQKLRKKVRGILNKLTLDKFDILADQLIVLIKETVDGARMLKESVKTIFDKALSEAYFASMYSDLCNKLSKELPEFPGMTGDIYPCDQSYCDNICFLALGCVVSRYR